MSKPQLVITRIIEAALGFSRLTHQEFLSRLRRIVHGMKDNPNFPNSPIDIAKFESAVEAYGDAVLEASDGSKKAKAERDNRRAQVTSMAKQLGTYVSHNCNGEMDKFVSSGFEPKSTTRTAQDIPDQPRIRKIKHGESGELLVYATPVSGAYSYELGYALADENRSTPGEWSVRPLPTARPAVHVTGLTPGKVYAFRIRALGKRDFTNWSDPAFLMCT